MLSDQQLENLRRALNASRLGQEVVLLSEVRGCLAGPWVPMSPALCAMMQCSLALPRSLPSKDVKTRRRIHAKLDHNFPDRFPDSTGNIVCAPTVNRGVLGRGGIASTAEKAKCDCQRAAGRPSNTLHGDPGVDGNIPVHRPPVIGWFCARIALATPARGLAGPAHQSSRHPIHQAARPATDRGRPGPGLGRSGCVCPAASRAKRRGSDRYRVQETLPVAIRQGVHAPRCYSSAVAVVDTPVFRRMAEIAKALAIAFAVHSARHRRRW